MPWTGRPAPQNGLASTARGSLIGGVNRAARILPALLVGAALLAGTGRAADGGPVSPAAEAIAVSRAGTAVFHPSSP